jgi:hypothetical protein
LDMGTAFHHGLESVWVELVRRTPIRKMMQHLPILSVRYFLVKPDRRNERGYKKHRKCET